MRLSLAPYEPAFLDVFLAWRAEERAQRHNPFQQLTREQARERLATTPTDFALVDDGDVAEFRWFVLEEGRPVGNVSLKNVNRMMRTAEIGYGIAASEQGRGLGKAAVRLLVDRVFSETALRRLFALVHDENEPSLRLLAALGFQYEGVLREHFLISGRPANEVVFGLLRREWEEFRAEPGQLQQG